LPRGTKENHKHPAQDSWTLGQN